jgi:hypothetical protein
MSPALPFFLKWLWWCISFTLMTSAVI